MLNEYNPFKKKEVEETEHGIINYRLDMGKCYITHRRKEHYFVKFKGFGISKSELEIAYNKRVYWVVILYTNSEGNTIPYRIRMEDVIYLEEYDNNGDIQKVVPLGLMEKKEIDRWI